MFAGADQLVDSRHFGPSSATFIRAGEDDRRGQPVGDGSGRRSRRPRPAGSEGNGSVAAFRVLFVCTANHCRSPIAEQLLAHDTAERFGASDAWQIVLGGDQHPRTAGRCTSTRQPFCRNVSRWSPTHRSVAADAVGDHRRRPDPDRVPSAPEHRGQHRCRQRSAGPSRSCSSPGSAIRSSRSPARTVARSAGNWSCRPSLPARRCSRCPASRTTCPTRWAGDLPDFTVCADRLQDAINRILRPLESAAGPTT